MGLEILNTDDTPLNEVELRKFAEILIHPKVLELEPDYPSNDIDIETFIEMSLKRQEEGATRKHVNIGAKLDDVLVGFFNIYRWNPPRDHVGNIGFGVHPDYWRMGIGTAMMEVGMNLAKKSGFVRLEADILMKNVGARKLAEQFGLKLEGIREKYTNMYGTFEDLANYALILR